tara:strand:- start:286 stop:621 length:336 start_codon:yes stop_codon:yes gene_type:complete
VLPPRNGLINVDQHPPSSATFKKALYFSESMAKKQGLGAVKRFGSRYGRTTRFKRAQIENEQKKPQKCPYCMKPKAKRQSIGIYDCKACGSTFTDEAYSVGKVRVVKEVEE